MGSWAGPVCSKFLPCPIVSAQHSKHWFIKHLFFPSSYQLSSFLEDPDLCLFLSSEGHNPQLSDCLWFSDSYSGLYVSYQIWFSPVNLSSINLIIRIPKEPRKVDKKFFLSYTSLSQIYNEHQKWTSEIHVCKFRNTHMMIKEWKCIEH